MYITKSVRMCHTKLSAVEDASGTIASGHLRRLQERTCHVLKVCPLHTQSYQMLFTYSLQLHMQAYANHDVIAKLEAAGLEFGPCQNAYTGLEETVFELAVPTDDPEH